jgi:hypothetical protein
MAVFWVVAPCSLVAVYKRFRGQYCLYHQGGWWRQQGLLKHWQNSARLHGATTLNRQVTLGNTVFYPNRISVLKFLEHELLRFNTIRHCKTAYFCSRLSSALVEKRAVALEQCCRQPCVGRPPQPVLRTFALCCTYASSLVSNSQQFQSFSKKTLMHSFFDRLSISPSHGMFGSISHTEETRFPEQRFNCRHYTLELERCDIFF